MNTNTHSVGHAGGTGSPTRRMKECQTTRVWVAHTPEAVPHRAPCGAQMGQISAEKRGSRALCLVRGTEGHDGPSTVVRVHGRAS